MKKLFKRALAFILLTVLLAAQACSFVAGDELQIADISHALMDDGTTRITITYNDEEIEPLEFFIPAGEKGEKGDGIEKVDYKVNDDKSTTVTIKYTLLDGQNPREDTVFTIPANAYVTGVTQADDPITGDKILTFNFSNGTGEAIPPVTVTLKHGKDGKDGDVVIDIVGEPYTYEDGTPGVKVIFTIKGADGETRTEEFTYQSPGGEDGKGVESITVDEEKTTTNSLYIYYIVTYDDGTSQELIVPKNNVWRNGEGAPNSSTEGRVGDYYVDTVGYKIYCKDVSGDWVVVLDLSQNSQERHQVRFMSEDGASWTPINIKHGSYFAAEKLLIPKPEKEGYKFLGWFTSDDPNDVNSGKFTDLTPVLSNLTLYQRWEEIVSE